MQKYLNAVVPIQNVCDCNYTLHSQTIVNIIVKGLFIFFLYVKWQVIKVGFDMQ